MKKSKMKTVKIKKQLNKIWKSIHDCNENYSRLYTMLDSTRERILAIEQAVDEEKIIKAANESVKEKLCDYESYFDALRKMPSIKTFLTKSDFFLDPRAVRVVNFKDTTGKPLSKEQFDEYINDVAGQKQKNEHFISRQVNSAKKILKTIESRLIVVQNNVYGFDTLENGETESILAINQSTLTDIMESVAKTKRVLDRILPSTANDGDIPNENETTTKTEKDKNDR